MEKKRKTFKNYLDFLQDEQFIEWRLLQTDELDRYWAAFAEEHPEYKVILDEAIEKFKVVKLNEYELSQGAKEKIYRKIIRTTNAQRQKRQLIKRRIIYWAAASVVLLITSTIFFMIQKNETPPEIAQTMESMDAIVGKLLPSSEIQLVTPEKVVELGKNAQITLSEDGRALVSSDVVETSDMKLSSDVMNRLIVPHGKRSMLQLADGSKVWLNSGTELEFPAVFKGETRKISVQGEIYIEVARMADQPFIVQTSRFEVLVHGTSFNVSAYAGSESQSVVLAEGKVEVSTSDHLLDDIAPNEMLTIIPGEVIKSKVDVSEYTSWKDGVLIFNKTPVSEILEKIGRYYNVEFKDNSNNRLSTRTCSGKLLLAENIDDVMSSLSVISSTIFSRENGMIYIKKR